MGGRGRRFWVGVSVVVALVALLGFVVPLGCSRIEEAGQLSYMTSDARQVYLGSKLYAEDHGGRWPETVGDLLEAELFKGNDFTIPWRVDASREGEPMYRILAAGRRWDEIGEREAVIASTVPVRSRQGAKWVVVLGSGDAYRVSRKELAAMGVEIE